MALHYNLAKVYDISDNDADFVKQILELYFQEVPMEIQNIKAAIKQKDYQKTYAAAHKIKPTFDLLGMNLAYDELIQIMNWAKAEGKKKDIIEVYKLLKEQIDLSSKEMKKDYNIK